jgi:hypothetical protein
MSVLDNLKCGKCGRKWHPPALCWAYGWLSEEDIETIAANIYNRAFDELELQRAQLVWESEGGR